MQASTTRTAAIALVVSASALAVAALTKAWFFAPGDSVGLLGVQHCHGGVCDSTSWLDATHVPAHIALVATLGLVGALVFVAFALHGAAALVRGEPRAVHQKLLNGALVVAAFGMTSFLLSIAIGDWTRGLSLGWSGVVGLGGAVAAAIVTGTMIHPLAKEERCASQL